MRQAFEKAAQVYEGVKKSVQEKWDGFKKKFEGAKSEMSQEVMNAKSPDDLIALGKKLQEQGEALKIEEQGVKQEGAGEDEKYEAGKKEMMDADYEEGHEMNKAFDENKAAEETAKEKARIAEEDRLRAEDEAVKLAEIRAKINGESAPIEKPQEKSEPTTVENAEQIKTPEESQYEFFKGTLKFDETGKMDSIFSKLRDNPIVMLEAYKKNPENLHWVSKRLSKDPEFVKQMEALGAGVKDGALKKTDFAFSFDDVDTNEKPTREGFEKAKSEAIAFNLARGSRSLEEMGVDKDSARAAIKDGVLKSLNYFGNGNTFDNQEQIKKAMEAIGEDMDEIINDPEVRKQIVDRAIPRMCSHISSDRSSFKWIDGLLNNLSKTFKVTKSEWEQATRSEWGGNSVREYVNSPERSF